MIVNEKEKVVTLTAEDLRKGFCPVQPKWGIKIFQLYGIEKQYKSELLESLKRCPKILKELGYRVVTEEGKEL
jgi:hypothetical protein